jgi:hypothetical protein
MEIGRKGFTELELQEFYPRVYKRLFAPKKRIHKPLKAIAAPKIVAVKAADLPKTPKPTKIAKIPKKNALKAAEKAAKKGERLQKNNSKLLEQLTFLNQRIETMERDKELYALVNTTIDDGNLYTFTVVRIGDESTPIILKVNDKFEMTCSCMDWNIRCRSLSVPCKHIYYLLVKILTYELYDYYDNQIIDSEGFKYLVRRRINHGGLNFEAKLSDELGDEMCAICYTQFADKGGEANLLQCPDCHKHLHRACVDVWMNHSAKRNCVHCKSEKWNMYFGGLVKKH